jgi:hypothetical protein
MEANKPRIIHKPVISLPYCVTGIIHWPLHIHVIEKMCLLSRSGINGRQKRTDGFQLVQRLLLFPKELLWLVIDYCPPEPSEKEIEVNCLTHILFQLTNYTSLWKRIEIKLHATL